jgi:hypothetical protein
MKELIKSGLSELFDVVKFFGSIVLGVVLVGIIFIYIPARIWGRHPKGEYTMVYNVYYNNTCKTCTIHNDLPIAVGSDRGTNYLSICKRSELFGDYYSTVYKTTAPIEVVSYTVKNKEK